MLPVPTAVLMKPGAVGIWRRKGEPVPENKANIALLQSMCGERSIRLCLLLGGISWRDIREDGTLFIPQERLRERTWRLNIEFPRFENDMRTELGVVRSSNGYFLYLAALNWLPVREGAYMPSSNCDIKTCIRAANDL